MADNIEKNKLIEEFKESRPLYEAFTNRVEGLVKTLLSEARINIHTVNSRTKTVDSFEKKLERKNYSYLTEITDLSGIRVICFSSGDVERVAKIIEKEFTILPGLSVDKKNIMEVDRFGYISLHYVARISNDRANMPEYSRYKEMLCEIQVRTMLQHAWAEIEHDLGYKSDIAVPNMIKRRFYRLASLLELADDEFAEIIKSIEIYTKKVNDQIRLAEIEIPIDKISLESYIHNAEIIRDIDKKIADWAGSELKDIINDTNKLLKILNYFEIKTIEELDRLLKNHSMPIYNFARLWMPRPNKEKRGYFTNGISIFYLGYLLAGMTNDEDKVKNYCSKAIGFQFSNKVIRSVIENANKASEPNN